MLAEVGHDGKVLAGGQSLVPMLSHAAGRAGAPRGHQPRRRARRVEVDDARRPGRCAGPARRSSATSGARARSRCCARRCGKSRTRRSATAARRSAASRTPTRRPRCRRCCAARRHGDGRRRARSRDVAGGRLLPRPAGVRAARADELAVGASFRRLAGRHAARPSSRSPAGTATTPSAGSAPSSRSTRRRSSAARAASSRVGPTRCVVDLTAAVAGRRRRTPTGRGRRAGARRTIDPEADIHATADYRRHLAAC